MDIISHNTKITNSLNEDSKKKMYKNTFSLISFKNFII